MEKLGFFIGLVALAVSIYPPDPFKNTARWLFWVSIIMIVVGAVALLRSYINLAPVWQLINRRLPLSFALDTVEGQTKIGRSELLGRAIGLARSGMITIYGEHGSSHRMTAIPIDYISNHNIGWFIDTMSTVDPSKTLGDQDT